MEFRILLYIYLRPGQPIKDVQAEVGLSHRGFYLKVQDFIESGYVSIETDSVDRRRRCLFPTELTKSLMQKFSPQYFPSILGRNDL